MLGAGDPIPSATVWTAPREQATLHDLAATGTVLFLFYLFDWTAT